MSQRLDTMHIASQTTDRRQTYKRNTVA